MKITRPQLKRLCTFAKYNNLMHRDFVDVILIYAALSAAFDEDNMLYLMHQNLLPVVSIEKIRQAIKEGDKLLDEYIKLKI